MANLKTDFCQLKRILWAFKFDFGQDGGEVGGNRAQFSRAQLEHLANLLRNRVNSQWNPSLYEVWRQKIVEDIEKQTVRRLQSPGERSLGSVQGPRLLWPLVRRLLQDTGRRVRSLAPSPTRAGRAAWHKEEPGCWKFLGGIQMKW